jgi:NADH-quinone oxidoreductase subunit L
VGRFCFILLSEGNMPAERVPFLQIMSLYLLAFMSLVGGFFQGGFEFWLSGLVATEHALPVVLQSVLLVLAGFWLAWKFYYSCSFNTDVVKRRVFVFYRIVMKKFYVDEIWEFLLTYTLEPVGSFCRFFDRRVIDGLFVNGTGVFFKTLSSYIRHVQTGTLQTYLLIGFTCVVLVIGFMRSF